MAIVRVDEVWDDRQSSFNDRMRRTYTRTFRVTTNSPLDGQLEAMAAIPIRFWDPYIGPAAGGEFDFGAICTEITARPDQDTPWLWLVTAHYSSANIDAERAKQKGDPSSKDDNSPMAKPPKIRWGGAKYRRTAAKDDYGITILNSAGLPFDPPAEIDDTRVTLSISRRESLAAFDPITIVRYKDATNIDRFLWGDPGTWKMEAPTAEFMFESQVFYWQVGYLISYDKNGWDTSLLDAGMMAYPLGQQPNQGNVGLRPIMDAQAHPVSQPVALDGQGHALPPNGTPVMLTGTIQNNGSQGSTIPFIIRGLDLTQLPSIGNGQQGFVWSLQKSVPFDAILPVCTYKPIGAGAVQIDAWPAALPEDAAPLWSFVFQARSIPQHLTFRTYRRQYFSALRLPNNLP